MSLRFWKGWLVVSSAIVIAFGAVLVLAPALSRKLFGLVLFGDGHAIASMGEASQAYIGLAHGVLGAVMAGWAVMLLLVAAGPFARGERYAWAMLTASLAAWFIPDTALSLVAGFWRNALLNVALAFLFAVPLAATRSRFASRA